MKEHRLGLEALSSKEETAACQFAETEVCQRRVHRNSIGEAASAAPAEGHETMEGVSRDGEQKTAMPNTLHIDTTAHSDIYTLSFRPIYVYVCMYISIYVCIVVVVIVGGSSI